MSKWAKLLQSHMAESSEPPSEEWKDAEQIAKEINRSPSTGRSWIRKNLKAGKLERKTFQIVRGGIRYPIAHYRAI